MPAHQGWDESGSEEAKHRSWATKSAFLPLQSSTCHPHRWLSPQPCLQAAPGDHQT